MQPWKKFWHPIFTPHYDIFRDELNILSWISTSNLHLWFQKSMNKIQCNLAKADPNTGLAKCLDMLLVNIFKQVCNFQSIETMLSRARLSLSSGKVRLTMVASQELFREGEGFWNCEIGGKRASYLLKVPECGFFSTLKGQKLVWGLFIRLLLTGSFSAMKHS